MQDLIIGNNWSFVRGGETVDGGVVSATVKPDIDPVGNWNVGPSIERSQIRPLAGSRVTRRAPNPGAYAIRSTFTIGRGLQIQLSLQEFSPLAFELLFLAPGKVIADAAFIPVTKGLDDNTIWAKFQMYDQDNTSLFDADLWCSAIIEPVTFGENLDPYALTLTVLDSDLNTAVLKVLTETARTA
jgi:hypothetical protein